MNECDAFLFTYIIQIPPSSVALKNLRVWKLTLITFTLELLTILHTSTTLNRVLQHGVLKLRGLLLLIIIIIIIDNLHFHAKHWWMTKFPQIFDTFLSSSKIVVLLWSGQFYNLSNCVFWKWFRICQLMSTTLNFFIFHLRSLWPQN